MPHNAAACQRLRSAAGVLHLVAMRKALEAGADANCAVCHHGGPLFAVLETLGASEDRQAECVQLLLQHGANPNGCGNKGISTPLMYCARAAAGKSPVMAVLLAAGADVQFQWECRTALHYAASPSAVYQLVGAGADVNSRTEWGGTPLHTATIEAPGVAMALLECGADPTLVDVWGETPLVGVLTEVDEEIASGFHSIAEDDDTPGRPAYLRQLAVVVRVLANGEAWWRRRHALAGRRQWCR